MFGFRCLAEGKLLQMSKTVVCCGAGELYTLFSIGAFASDDSCNSTYANKIKIEGPRTTVHSRVNWPFVPENVVSL